MVTGSSLYTCCNRIAYSYTLPTPWPRSLDQEYSLSWTNEHQNHRLGQWDYLSKNHKTGTWSKQINQMITGDWMKILQLKLSKQSQVGGGGKAVMSRESHHAQKNRRSTDALARIYMDQMREESRSYSLRPLAQAQYKPGILSFLLCIETIYPQIHPNQEVSVRWKERCFKKGWPKAKCSRRQM